MELPSALASPCFPLRMRPVPLPVLPVFFPRLSPVVPAPLTATLSLSLTCSRTAFVLCSGGRDSLFLGRAWLGQPLQQQTASLPVPAPQP